MTQDKLDIRSVAIIGAGPGGLASLYEFLHTDNNGNSSVGRSQVSKPKFEKIVAFEQKDKAGGIWAPSVKTAGLNVPPQDILDTESYDNPDIIHPKSEVPKNVEQFTTEKPLVKPVEDSVSRELEWNESGVFHDLFTNIPSRFIRFSYMPNEEKYSDKRRSIYPFLTYKELSNRVERLIEKENLYNHIRTNTRVESVYKKGTKWVVVTRQNKKKDSEEWYHEEFDAVVVANGHYTVPYFPHIEGLANYNKKYPGTIIHSKAYRDRNIFKGKKVLVVGSSFSSLNLIQYAFPLAKQTFLSKRGPHLVFPWIEKASFSHGINVKPTIKKFIPERKEVEFTDGSIEKDFDVILFATGYHYHYPFLENQLKVKDPSNLSRVGGLYLDTFTVEDPTLAAIGVAVSQLNFHTIEASASAIAGVWTNAKSLPPKKDMIAWEVKRKEETADNLLFHFYPPEGVRSFVNLLSPYFPKNRIDPLHEDGKYFEDFSLANNALESLFYRLKDGTLDVQSTLLDN